MTRSRRPMSRKKSGRSYKAGKKVHPKNLGPRSGRGGYRL